MMKPFPHICGECREGAVEPATLPSYTMAMEHDGRRYEVTVPDLHVFQCAKCQAILFNDAASERLDEGLRHAAGLLAPAKIKSSREALGLTQVQMAGYLKVGPSTLSRWETGGQIQQRAMDLLLRAFFQVPEFCRFLGCAGEAMAPSWPIAEARMTAESVASR